MFQTKVLLVESLIFFCDGHPRVHFCLFFFEPRLCIRFWSRRKYRFICFWLFRIIRGTSLQNWSHAKHHFQLPNVQVWALLRKKIPKGTRGVPANDICLFLDYNSVYNTGSSWAKKSCNLFIYFGIFRVFMSILWDFLFDSAFRIDASLELHGSHLNRFDCTVEWIIGQS